jgi:aromatic-L-amino-acid/L-tryptophan decarboxylase
VTGSLHQLDPELARRCLGWLVDRLTQTAPLGATALPSELAAALGSASITNDGIGLDEAWRRFAEVLAPANTGLASERFLGFIPAAPTAAAVLMDAMVGAASFSAESWLEASGAVHAENEVLAWLARVAGFPECAAGCFVSGGSSGNLSALAVAREHRRGRPAVAVADTAHSSVANALRLLGMDTVVVPTGADGRLTGRALGAAISGHADVGVVVASAGSTNAGAIDDLAGVAEVCARTGAWMHVDGAYGGAGLLVDRLRPLYRGIERADSLIVDPHKWLFSTLGSCALLYRNPSEARHVHTQHASYLDSFHSAEAVLNPADHAFHLTRRAAGLPIWFSLAVHGVAAHAAAVDRGVELAQLAARRINELAAQGAPVELVIEPQLSVVLFRRSGWDAAAWQRWCTDLLASGTAFVTSTSWQGETVGRLVFLHPDTPETLIDDVLAPLISSS